MVCYVNISLLKNVVYITIHLCIPLSVSVKFSHSVVSNSLRPHKLQHARPPCPSPTPGVHPNPRPSSWWRHPTISSSVAPSPPALNLSQHQGLFQWVGFSHQGGYKCWSFHFSISPSSDYSRLISFTIGWFDLVIQGTLKSFLQHQFESINSSMLSLLYSPALTSIHDYWKNQSCDYTDLCWPSLCFLICCLGLP